MSRRKLVVLSSALALLGLGFLIALVIILGTQTSYGRDYIRQVVLDYTKGMRGKVYIGRIGGNLFTGVTIDSLELRDPDDSVFVATGPISVAYDPRDFVDRRVLVRYLSVERPLVVLHKHEDQVWNYRRLFPSGGPKPRRSERGFGDYVVIDSADIRDGRVVLTMPWHPADSLDTKARRDSAIRRNLRDAAGCDTLRCWSEIRAGYEKPDTTRASRPESVYKKTYRWTGMTASLAHARLADPDSVGRSFVISALSADEVDPPMRFRDIRGTVRHLGDSIWLDVPRFRLPGSVGRASGKVVWGDRKVGGTKRCEGVLGGERYAMEDPGGCPVRYDIDVWGEKVSLADINWVYPMLPTEGGGSMKLKIRNRARELKVLEYALDSMDVRTTGSRLRGRMTWGVGGPVVALTDVAVDALPVDFRLLRHVNGKPFPYPWAGTIAGRVVGRGGPLDRFMVDSARFTFRDANVPGAVTTGAARGMLDILFPAYTEFRGFAVQVDQLDLRTLQFLNPNFPRVNGIASGRALLDSSWLDVRFRDAELVHVDGPGEATRLTGSGRATLETVFVRWDLSLQAEPLSLSMLARSYTMLPARGLVRGPIRVQGTTEDLTVNADLTGPAGRMTWDGWMDIYQPPYAARGTARVEGLDLRRLFERDDVPASTLTGTMVADVRGDTTTNLDGTVRLTIDRSLVDGMRVYGGTAALALTPGHVRIDTLTLETAAAALAARGGLGLVAGRRDTVRFSATADSLGGMRRWLLARTTDGRIPDDTLAGMLRVDGVLAGSIDSLALRAALVGAGLRVAETRVSRLRGDAAIDDVTRVPHGTVTLAVDTSLVGGTTVTSAALGLDVLSATSARWRAEAATRNGVRLDGTGAAVLAGDTTRVRMDSVQLVAGDDRWRLVAPVEVASAPDGVSLGLAQFAGTLGGRIAVTATLPLEAPASGTLRAENVPMATLGLLAQAPAKWSGRAGWSVTLAGTRLAPRLAMQATLDSASFGGVSLERVTAGWDYADRQAKGSTTLWRRGAAVLVAEGTLPVDLALVPVARRLVDGVPLELTVSSERVDLAVVESFSPVLQRARGTFEANVNVRGTWRRPALTGVARVTDGALTVASTGVRLERIGAELAFRGDTLAINRLQASTNGDTPGRIAITGGINFANFEDPTFDLQVEARDFLAMRRPRVATLALSTVSGRPLTLVGSQEGARLTGGLEVTRGEIYIPEFTEKRVQSLDDPEFYRIVDTSLFTNRTLLPSTPPELLRNLVVDDVQVRLGDNVWLRSAEANINLGGAVNVTTGPDQRTGRTQLALLGTISTVKGTYRLNLAGGVLSRTFAVEDGNLVFRGDPDLNPELNISALYVVRQPDQSRADVPIRIRIGGTLAQPTLTLSSADNITRDPTDLVSYLVTGQPNFDVAATDPGGTLVNLGVSSLGGLIESRATRYGVDYVNLQTGRYAGAAAFGFTGGLTNALSGTRATVGVQLTDRTFLNLNYGLCSAGQLFGTGSGSAAGEGTPITLAKEIGNVGARIDLRLSRTWSVSTSSEPSTSALSCRQAGSGTLLTTPRQWGLDFSKKWEF